MNKIFFRAYAKINLFLDVLGKRDDDYHDILSVASLINLSDLIHAEINGKEIEVFCSDSDIPEGNDNLVHKLLIILRERNLLKKGIKVFINKEIPSKAGFGGGTSDAAFTLVALNKHLKLKLDKKLLKEILLEVGSDGPLFLTKTGTVLIEGRGEIVTDISMKNYPWVVLLFPCGIVSSTPELYKKINNKLTKKEALLSNATTLLLKKGVPYETAWGFNRFEEILTTECPVVAEMTGFLRKGGAGISQLTGTGTAVFGLFSSLTEAVRAEKEAIQKGWWVRITQFYRP
ncbi:MAG: 4-(cytidine 5'-diphospho)-2-C-methyl-D-erythritol kinase [Candidatus Coatesbacteria bacterium]|nr:4-(cytidine 5'-diphospho)-2-C-methyl-D-erythritol kinase [Candidatus Coatesbacteria bacterium]